jgi:hypothetical protein
MTNGRWSRVAEGWRGWASLARISHQKRAKSRPLWFKINVSNKI